jgi:hypothetical protein
MCTATAGDGSDVYALTKILRMTKTIFPTDSYIIYYRLIQYFYD